MKPFDPASAEARPMPSAADPLNAVPVSAVLLQGAMEALARLPAHLRDRPAAQALALQAYVADEGFADATVSAALHARIVALAGWAEAHDPDHQSNAGAVIEAAARFALSETGAGLGFEPGGLQELVLFIEDLPW